MKSTESPDINQTPASAVTENQTFYISRRARLVASVAHWIILALSLGLIVFISYDTFAGIPFLKNHTYMTFQFWVCVVFMADFFVELFLSVDKKRYLLTHILFFLISIPYLNLLPVTDIELSSQQLYFLRFVPLVRGAYSLALVVGYLSSNKATNIVASYAAILAAIIYFSSLIFYEQELPVNSDVNDYWSALWWTFMNVTTIGCYINPMTVAGKVCGALLAGSGMLMLPLFTVYVTSLVKNYNDRNRLKAANIRHAWTTTLSGKPDDHTSPTTGTATQSDPTAASD